MSSDLLFSILPREGKVPITQNEQKVQKVSKEAKLKSLSDEEEELHHEELEVREKIRSKSKKEGKDHHGQKDEKPALPEDAEQNPADEDKKGPKHLDVYV